MSSVQATNRQIRFPQSASTKLKSIRYSDCAEVLPGCGDAFHKLYINAVPQYALGRQLKTVYCTKSRLEKHDNQKIQLMNRYALIMHSLHITRLLNLF